MLTQKLSFISIFGMALIACSPPETVEHAPNVADMARAADPQPSQPPRPSCPAADGIPGEILLCADFSKITSLADPSLGNWTYSSDTTTPDCWQIADGHLANKNLNTVYRCGVTLPGINLEDPALQKLSRFTLSIKYKLDLRSGEQTYAYLSSQNPNSASFLFWETGIDQRLPDVQETRAYTTERSQLPSALNNLYRPTVAWYSTYKNAKGQGWQISSVAILGAP